MVYRIFTEKKKKFAAEAAALLSDINTLLQIKSVTALRIVNRYDAENITEELFRYAVKPVFSEPQLDDTYESLENDGAAVFAVEYLPGQFDQRADSAAQCIGLISKGDRPLISRGKQPSAPLIPLPTNTIHRRRSKRLTDSAVLMTRDSTNSSKNMPLRWIRTT